MEQKQKLMYIGLGLVGTVVFLVGVYFLINDPNQALRQPGEQAVYENTRTITAEDHTKWSDTNEIILAEYSDLQCPACGTFHTFLNQIETGTDADSQAIRENITLVYRHFPLLNIHPKAFDAAIAAEAAARQNSFFQYVDLLFENQQEWSAESDHNNTFVEYARTLELDTQQFQTDLNDESIRQKVTTDIQTGETANVNATPSFFLNGERMEYSTFDDFTQQLLDAIDMPETEPAQETATEEGNIQQEQTSSEEVQSESSQE